MISFTIPLNPVTKKNSQTILVNKATGRPFIMPSKNAREYEKEAKWFIPKVDEPIDYPVNVECKFFMQTRRKVDLTNLLENIDDVMVKAGLLADDNHTILATHNGSAVYYDKENPRTEVRITKIEPRFTITMPTAQHSITVDLKEDMSEFNAFADKQDGATVTLVTGGRLSDYKNLSHLVDEMEKLAADYDN